MFIIHLCLDKKKHKCQKRTGQICLTRSSTSLGSGPICLIKYDLSMIGSLCIYQGDYEYMIVTYLTHSSTVILSPGLLSCKTRVATQYSPGVVRTVTITVGDMGQATLGICNYETHFINYWLLLVLQLI